MAHKKTKTELEEELKEQVEAFRDRAASYDSGKLWESKYLAAIAYILCHDGTGRTKSLLGQLGLRTKVGYRSTPALFPPSPIPLIVRVYGADGGAEFLPPLDTTEKIKPASIFPFKKWWEENPVFFTAAGSKLSRKNVVFAIRTQMGGAHVDDNIKDEAFFELATLGPPHLKYNDGMLSITGGEGEPVRNGYQALMRQIAWELNETLKDLGL